MGLVGLLYIVKLNIAHVNLNNLTNKTNFVYNFLCSSNVDILGISESWLTSEISDSSVLFPNYDIVRCDSLDGVRKHGVALYIRKSIKYIVIDCDLSNIVVVYLHDFHIYVITVYRPPSNDVTDNRILMGFLLQFCPDKEIVLQGDFNLPSLKWDLDEMYDSYIYPCDREFFELFMNLGLAQIIKKPTIFPSANILDLFLTSDPERVGEYNVLPPFPGCAHCPIVVSYIFQLNNVNSSSTGDTSSVRAWSKGKYNLIADCISFIDWYDELYTLNAAEQYRTFLNILQPLIERYVPLRTTREVSRLPWSVNPPGSLLRAKASSWNCYKSARSAFGRNSSVTQVHWDEFQSINTEIKAFCYYFSKNV